MKTIEYLLLPLIGCAACTSLFPMESEADSSLIETEVVFEAFTPEKTRSLFGGASDEINSLCVFVFRDSLLYDDLYSENGSCSFKAMSGCRYDVYAFANTARLSAPMHESQMESYRMSVSSAADLFSKGIPMACKRVLDLSGPGKERVSEKLEMLRLAARYDLSLAPSLRETEYEIKSVKVCSAAMDVTAFSPWSRAVVTGDGDMASQEDISTLNSGGSVSFYMLENCNGVLLPGNTDPWKKTPSSIGNAGENCTYIEVCAHWKTQGADADMVFRMYLGADNCSDFNVRRNSLVKIALCLSDSLSYRTEWKASTVSFDDRRSISFKESEIVVWQCTDWAPVSQLVLDPPDISYSAYVEGEGLKSKVENGTLYLKTDYYGASRLKGSVVVTSWDGLHTAKAAVRTDFVPDPFTGYSMYDALYLCETGWFSFPDASASKPVEVVIGGERTVSIGSGSGTSFMDEDSGVFFAYKGGSNTLRYQIREIRKPVQVSLIRDRMQSDVTLAQNVKIPVVRLVGEAVASEAGNCFYDSADGIYYDSFLDASLFGQNGESLDLDRFKAGSVDGFPETDELGYSRFKLVGSPELKFSESGYVGADIRTNSSAYGNSLARVYLYGVSRIDGEKRLSSEFLCSVNGERKSSTGEVTMYQAFPNQGFLGTFYNYQLAPSPLRSDRTTMGIYTEAPSPCSELTTWSVQHAYNHSGIRPTGFTPVADDYSSSMTIDRGVMLFSEFTPQTYPACGGMKIEASTVNPHSGLKTDGSYTLDLVLYLSLGMRYNAEKGTKFSLEYFPFCEYWGKEYSDTWKSHMTQDCIIRDGNGNEYNFLAEDGSGLYELDNVILDPKTKKVSPETFTSKSFLFDFSFATDPSAIGYELNLDHNFYIGAKLSLSSRFGEKGYYHFVRQCDVGSASVSDPVYEGLENHIVNYASEY